jgi:hypothetical protein
VLASALFHSTNEQQIHYPIMIAFTATPPYQSSTTPNTLKLKSHLPRSSLNLCSSIEATQAQNEFVSSGKVNQELEA